ncbi:SDR family NAD(P)-dependent oxidoreductase, partial [Streptococcus suis]
NIGHAYCDGLVAAGANIVMADLQDLSVQAKAYGKQAIAMKIDVSDSASIEAMAKQTHTHFGRIDGIINNAGF